MTLVFWFEGLEFRVQCEGCRGERYWEVSSSEEALGSMFGVVFVVVSMIMGPLTETAGPCLKTRS